MTQADQWNEITAKLELDDLVRQAQHPDEFQLELKKIIDAFCVTGCSNILEAGSFTGVTSLSLDDRFNKTLLDLNPSAVQLSEKVFRYFEKKATFVVGDMFEMPFEDGQFDLVFNAGVLEHFDFADRVRALKEYARVLAPDGVMIIGYPNHYSRPYRLTYEYLNRADKWPYPLEMKLYDLREEIQVAGLRLDKRVVVARKTAFRYLSCLRLIPRLLLQALFTIVNYEGYLAVTIIGKR